MVVAPELPPDLATGDDGIARWYSLFGMRVLSDITLPMPPIQVERNAEPGCTFERAEPGRLAPAADGDVVSETRCHGPCHSGRIISRVHRGASGSWIWHDSLATFWISPDGRRVVVYPAADADESLLRMFLIGQISTVVLHQRGYPSLHSSAIQTEHGAVVFLGPRGQGKSTMAAAFLNHGQTLITDDALPLRVRSDGIYGGPGISIMKLWTATAENTLGLTEELPTFLHNYDKKLLRLDGRYTLADRPTRIAAVYVLNRYEPAESEGVDVSLQRLPARDGHAALIAQTSWSELLLPGEKARLIPLYAKLVAQAPVRLLRFPHGFTYQEEVRARILADVAEA